MKSMLLSVVCGGAMAIAMRSVSAEATGTSQLACPASLSGETIRLAPPPSGWMARPSKIFMLYSAGFNDGPPERLAQLKPVSVGVSKGQSVESWRFDDGEFVDGLWLLCAYGGAAGDITLARKIDAVYSSCTVNYSPGKKAGARNITIACR